MVLNEVSRGYNRSPNFEFGVVDMRSTDSEHWDTEIHHFIMFAI